MNKKERKIKENNIHFFVYKTLMFHHCLIVTNHMPQSLN